MKVAIYSRYSTDLQDTISIAGQIANCEALATREGFNVVTRYQDAAQSGNDDNRPQYQQLLADSEAGLFDAIIVDETSRLTRRPGELPRLLEILAFRSQFLFITLISSSSRFLHLQWTARCSVWIVQGWSGCRLRCGRQLQRLCANS